MCARPANPELREKILEAATSIVEGCGPDCVTMRQVADEVGYSPTTLYLYFKDKDAILAEVVTLGMEDLAGFCTSAQVGPTPLDELRQRGRAYVVWGLLHPGLYRLMFEYGDDPASFGSMFTPEQHERMKTLLKDGSNVVDAAIAAGQLVGIEDPRGYEKAAWAGFHGVTSLAISRRLVPEGATLKPEELLETATRAASVLLESMIATHSA